MDTVVKLCKEHSHAIRELQANLGLSNAVLKIRTEGIDHECCSFTPPCCPICKFCATFQVGKDEAGAWLQIRTGL